MEHLRRGHAGQPVATCEVKWLAISEPNTATPTAPPICRVVSFTAEPTPALARGSDPMIESVHGAMMLAIPRPMITVMAITWSALLLQVERAEQRRATW